MAFGSRNVVVPIVVLTGVIAAAAFYFLQPAAVSTRSDTQLERIMQTCEDKLSGLAEETIFEGADVEGSPEHALAEYIKWSWLSPLQWVGRRDDLRMIISYGAEFENCYRFDTAGYVVASHSRHKDAETTRWLKRSDDGGPATVTLMERDPAVLDGAPTAWYTLGAESSSGMFMRTHLAGRNAGESAVDGSFRFSPATRQLELHVRQDEKVLLTANGLLVRSHYRVCFDPDAPCDEPWETTTYAFDAAGNLTQRDIDLGTETRHDELVPLLNDRGDWIEWRFKSAAPDSQPTRRAIIYRE